MSNAGNVIADGAYDVGQNTAVNAQTIASEYTTNSISGFYNDFTVEG